MATENFRNKLRQEVRVLAEVDGRESSLNATFTRMVLDLLVDAGSASDPQVAEADFASKRMKVSAIDWEQDRGLLSVYVSRYFAEDEPPNVTKSELRSLFSRLEKFVVASSTGLHRDLEESSDVFDAAQQIQAVWAEIKGLRLIAIFNSNLRTEIPPPSILSETPVRYDVWDIERIERLASSGQSEEPIEIDLSDFGYPDGIAVLGPKPETDYEAYLLVVPGDLLADIYEEYGPRLLELNVRSFLQARGKTNQGIQQTIRDQPERFLAYNNGLSLTASTVEVRPSSEGAQLLSLRGLQVVNGGQTTASLYYASRKSKLDLSRVAVQAKLTVVSEQVREEFAPLISRYANTQNQVRMADFSANDPFHVELEKISRVTWAPAPEGTHEMTHWFYERSRGQYADALGREKTPAQKKKFSNLNPRRQLFTKTDVAKFEHAWGQLPNYVAMGAEKNFKEFTQRLAESKSARVPDVTYFQHLVAKAIIWKKTEAIVTSLALGGYRSAAVAYTIALISHKTAMRVDLAKIWNQQDISPMWRRVVEELAPRVHASLITTAGNRNVLEWAKKQECWEALSSMGFDIPASLADGGVEVAGRVSVARSAVKSSLPASNEELDGQAEVIEVGATNWLSIAAWAKETSNLQPWQRGLAYSVGIAIGRSRVLSVKQVIQARKILVEVRRLGFEFETGTDT